MDLGELRFLYVGTDDTEAAVRHCTTVMGGRLRWRFQAFGADVAAIDLGTGAPIVMLADHRPAGSVLPIYEVADLAAAEDEARASGSHVDGPLGSPEGDAIVVRDAGGVEIALLQVDRPGAMDGAWLDETNNHRVR